MAAVTTAPCHAAEWVLGPPPPCLLLVPLLLRHTWVGVVQGLITGTCSCPRDAPTRVKTMHMKGFSHDEISFHCIIFCLCDLKRKRSERRPTPSWLGWEGWRTLTPSHPTPLLCRSVTPAGLQGARTPSLHRVPVLGGFWCPPSPLVTPPPAARGLSLALGAAIWGCCWGCCGSATKIVSVLLLSAARPEPSRSRRGRAGAGAPHLGVTVRGGGFNGTWAPEGAEGHPRVPRKIWQHQASPARPRPSLEAGLLLCGSVREERQG